MSDVHGYIGPEQVERVRAAVSLVDTVAAYTAVRKAGSEFVALCPFHQERTPSFTIFEGSSGWVYQCKGCQVTGDVFKLIQEKEGLTFPEAVEQLARSNGITLVYAKSNRGEDRGPSKDRLKAATVAAAAWHVEQLAGPFGTAAREYLHGRGFTAATLTTWSVGWAPGHGQLTAHLTALGFTPAELVAADLSTDTGRDRFFERIVIPITDQFGHAIAFTGRLLPAAEAKAKAEGKSIGKYINSSETPIYHKGSVLFGFALARKAINEAGRAMVVEGPLDVLAAHQLGRPATVASCGTALTDAHIDRLRPLVADGGITLLFDGDNAGAGATLKAIQHLWPFGIRVQVAALDGAKDLGDVVQAGKPLADVEQAPMAADVWLLKHLIPTRPRDELDRLPVADAVLKIIVLHCDPLWRELVAERLGAHLGLSATRIRSRLKAAMGQAEPETPETPSKPAAGASDGDDDSVRDGGNHQKVVRLLQRFLVEEAIDPDAVGGWLRAGTDVRVAVTLKALVSRFYFRYAPRFDSLSPERSSLVLSALVDGARRARRAAVLYPITGMSANPQGVIELARWVKAVTGRDDPVDLAVMLHFIWQVKRRSTGGVIEHDLMPIVHGFQGDGKSRAVKLLCRPLKELTRQVNAEALTDDRAKQSLAEFHVGIWDELQGGSRADVQALKHIISADEVSYRELGTHSTAVLPKSITLIGTSNDRVADIITDTTGARRFYEINSQQPCDWETINTIDYMLVWQAVHQDDAAPFHEHATAIRERQTRLVHVDGVCTWLQGETFDVLTLVDTDRPYGEMSNPGNHVHIPAMLPGQGEICDHLVRRWQRWVRLSGAQAVAPNKLGTRLKALGWSRLRDKDAPRAWRYHPPADIPDDWALASRFGSTAARPSKTADQRAATNADAATLFGAQTVYTGSAPASAPVKLIDLDADWQPPQQEPFDGPF